MKNLKMILALAIIAMSIVACSDEEPGGGSTPILPETIGGDYGTNLVLVNRVENSDLADYYVDETISMTNGAGLIVEPGVVIEFAPNTRFQLGLYSEGFAENGYIDADGTAAEPIVFRGIDNMPGAWNGIMIGCSSPDFRNQLNHCIIEYAGGSNGYAVRIEDCTSGSMGLLSITNTIIRHTQGNGLESYGQNVINQFSGNTFENNSGTAILIPAQEFTHIDGQTRFSNNGTNGVASTNRVYAGNLDNDESHVWKDLDGGNYYVNDFIRVYSGSLTLQPNTRVIMGSNTGLASDDDAYIRAIGTESSPVFIFGEQTGTPTWDGIYIYSKNTPNEFRYCHVSEAGADGDAAFNLDSPYTNCCGYTATIANCNIRYNGGCGIYTDTENASYLTQSDNQFTDNSGSDVCIN